MPKRAQNVNKTRSPAKTQAASSNDGTVAERIAAVMGNKEMTSGDLMEALAAAGERFESKNLRMYMSTVLNSTMTTVMDSANEVICGKDGKPIRVHVFTSVRRGVYRVSTNADFQAEVNQKLNGVRKMVQPKAVEPPATPQLTLPSPQSEPVSPSMASAPAVNDAPTLGGIPDLRGMVRAIVVNELKTLVREELSSILQSVK